jgi:hypothetical protein
MINDSVKSSAIKGSVKKITSLDSMLHLDRGYN